MNYFNLVSYFSYNNKAISTLYLISFVLIIKGDPPTVTCGGNTTDPATTPNPIPTTSKDSQNGMK